MNHQFVSVHCDFTSACPECGGDVPALGGQALISNRLEWSIETACPGCGPIASCGRQDMPAGLREGLLADPGYGPATLQITLGESDSRAVVMKVIRASLGGDLGAAKAMLATLQSGEHVGTMPEMEQLARALRAVGISAHVSPRRPAGTAQ